MIQHDPTVLKELLQPIGSEGCEFGSHDHRPHKDSGSKAPESKGCIKGVLGLGSWHPTEMSQDIVGWMVGTVAGFEGVPVIVSNVPTLIYLIGKG